ncbi:MAG: hypothetical protein ABIN48_15120 [Ginsengibacter sp.]
MLNLITSYLIQTGEIVLPGIGTFSSINIPATLDIANKELKPPVMHYRFSDMMGQPEEKMVQYIAYKKELTNEKALEEIKNFSKELKEKILSGETIELNCIGILQKDSSNNIIFKAQENLTQLEPVSAIRVVHKEVKHSMIVGDIETDSEKMNELLNGEDEKQPGNSFWKIAATILLLIGAGVLFYHYYYSNSSNPIGNGSKVVPQTKNNTYIIPK